MTRASSRIVGKFTEQLCCLQKNLCCFPCRYCNTEWYHFKFCTRKHHKNNNANMWPYMRKSGIWDKHTISAMHIFLYLRSKICQSPDFITSMSKNLSSNCYRRLRRLVVSYKGKISLHFDLPRLYSCCRRSLLLKVIIRICVHGLSEYS